MVMMGHNASGTTKNQLSNTASLNFPSVAAGATAELTISVVGAQIGDVVFASPETTLEADLLWSAYVSATDVVTVRVGNLNLLAPINPTARTWRVVVLHA